MKKSTLTLLFILLFLVGSSKAETIAGTDYTQPVSAAASSYFIATSKPWLYSPNGIINGNGLDTDTGEHENKAYIVDTQPGYIWMSDGAIDTDPNMAWVVFDLGDVYELSEIRIWNGNNTSPVDETDRGVKSMYILVSTDGINYTQVGGLFNLIQASGASNYLGEVYPLSADNVRYVKFDIRSTWRFDNGGDPYTALSEVRFVSLNVPAQDEPVGMYDVLFYDNFESATFPSPYSWESQNSGSSPQTDSDPDGASSGTWDVYDITNLYDLQATTSLNFDYDPGPYEGDGYFRLRCPSASAYTFADFVNEANEGLVHAEWYFLTDIDNVNHGMIVELTGSHTGEGAADSRVSIATQPDGSIEYYSGSWQNTGLTYDLDKWQKWEIDYLVGTNEFYLTVDDVTVGPLTSKSIGYVSSLAFRGGAAGGKGWFDRVFVYNRAPLKPDQYTQGLWNFEPANGFNDIGGSTNNVMTPSTTRFTDGPLGLGRALVLGDGNTIPYTGYATVSDHIELENPANDFTVEAWVKISEDFLSVDRFLHFVSKYGTGSGERSLDIYFVYDA